MRIQLIDSATRKPIANAKLQLQIKGKDSGYLSLTTDGSGFFILDGKYDGQQITSTTTGLQGQWVNVKDNLQYYVTNTMAGAGTGTKQKQTTTTHNNK